MGTVRRVPDAPGDTMVPRDPMACERCGAVHDPTRCNAHRRKGDQCTKPPVPGARVCRMHGGSAPQTVAKARERLLAAADPAALKLTQLVKSKDEGVALRAATAVLDRAGLTRDFSGGRPIDMPDAVDPQLVVEFITGVLDDLSIAITDEVREVVATRLRAMSAAQHRARSTPQPAELVDA